MRWPEAALPALAALALSAGALAAERESEYSRAIETIRCDCGCHPQSVADCACGRAAEMRREIAAQIDQGRSAEEVIAAYVARHGEQIRIVPEARGFSLVAWLGPLVLLPVAAWLVVAVLRRWRRRVEPALPALDPDDPYLARVERELEGS